MGGRRWIACVVVGAVALGVAGCGEEAKSTRATTTDASKARVETTKPEVLRRESVDLSGWNDDAWPKLGGRPDAWPVDLIPPLSTERATLLISRDGRGDEVTILSGRVPGDPEALADDLRERFGSWEEVDGVGTADERGSWERDDVHVTVTVREDGERASTYGFILRER